MTGVRLTPYNESDCNCIYTACAINIDRIKSFYSTIIRNDYGNDQGMICNMVGTIGMINGTLESDIRNDRNGHDGNEID